MMSRPDSGFIGAVSVSRLHQAAILGIALLVACVPQPEASEQVGSAPPELTVPQIERYLNSYPAVRAMASRYWGKRRYSPASQALPSEGTFDRAYAEMEAAGDMPDFELLLQSVGYNDPRSWIQLNERIAYAYGMLRLAEKNPAHFEHWKAQNKERRASLGTERAKLEEMPEGLRAERLKSLNRSEQELERYLLAERDVEALRPFASDIEKANR
jgi:hypothetical protein